MSKETVGSIFLPSISALAVWREEVLGQLSDGMWENTSPTNHWEFWHKLVTKLGEPSVVMDEGKHVPYRQKTSYNIAGLYEYVGDRMLAYGRMGRAIERAGAMLPAESPDYDVRWGKGGFDAAVRAGEHLQRLGTLDEFLKREWDKDDNYAASYLKNVSDELARAFFETKYEMPDLKRDVKSIKLALKTLKTHE